MATITQEARFELSRRELVSVVGARGHTLRCDSGELWITLDGQASDLILLGGETCVIPTDAEVVISAFRASTLSVHRCHALGSLAGSARRLLCSLHNRQFPPLAVFPVQLIR